MIGNSERIKESNDQTKNKSIETNKLVDSLSNIADLHQLEENILDEHKNSEAKKLKSEIMEITQDNKISLQEKQWLKNMMAAMQDQLEDIFGLDDVWIDFDIFDNEFNKLKKLWYSIQEIKKILLQMQKKLQNISQNKRKKISESLLTNFLLPQKLQETIIGDIYKKIINIKENKNTISFDTTLAMIAYLIENKKNLEEEQQKKLMEKLWKLIVMQYLERKKVEIYEINIDENGNIIITTRDGTHITILKDDWDVLGSEFINKFVDKEFSDEDIQQLKNHIMEHQQKQPTLQKTNKKNTPPTGNGSSHPLEKIYINK